MTGWARQLITSEKTSGDVTAALRALICSRASGVLSHALEEAVGDERNPWPIAEGENWRVEAKVQGLRNDVQINRWRSPGRCWGWLIWPFLWVAFGGALRDFRRNSGFHTNQENLWSRQKCGFTACSPGTSKGLFWCGDRVRLCCLPESVFFHFSLSGSTLPSCSFFLQTTRMS